MNVDFACSLGVVIVAVLAGVAYALRVAAHGRARSARVEREGRSVLVGKGAMEMTHWVLTPVAEACVRARIGANAVSWTSLGLGLSAGVALGAGHFGLAAVLTALGSLGDALDGAVARASGEASDAGEVLDAAIDRYVELAFLGGLAFHWRERPAALVLVLGAIAGSFMVSYATAKAEALRVEAPRGSMRRTERAVYLLAGVALTPLLAAIDALPPSASDAPALAAVVLVAVVGNASAVRRLAAVARAVKRPGDARAAPIACADGDAHAQEQAP
jgi:CDP-diacylglycerol---glycerol-3-phosphate 3-phosphatidyltransferase